MISWETMLAPLYHSSNCSTSAPCAKYQPVTDNTFYRPIIDFIGLRVCKARAEEGEVEDMLSFAYLISTTQAFE